MMMSEMDSLQATAMVVAGAFQSGKMHSYDPKDIAACFEEVFLRVEKCKRMSPTEIVNRIKD